MKIKVKIYDGSKYDMASEKVDEIKYSSVKSVEVKMIDNEEYAVITFEYGETATFDNSHVDIFRD